MAAMPLVSIMMPAWNVGEHILQAIESCQMQTYPDWELCVVDDGSDDETYNIIFEASLKDSRIRLEKQYHQGCPVARNKSLAMMTGEIVVRQDADDLQDKTRIEKCVNVLLKLPLDIVSTKMYWLQKERLILQKAGGMQITQYMEGRGGRPVNASIVAWKRVYDIVGGFKEEQIAGSDGDWNFRAILEKMKWGFIPEPLYIYRRHPGQITKRLGSQQRATHDATRKYYYKRWKDQ